MSWFGNLFKKKPKPQAPPQPQYKAVAVVVSYKGQRVVGAIVELLSSDRVEWGKTDNEGVVVFPFVPAGLTETHVWVYAEGFKKWDSHVDLTFGINQQIWVGGTPEQDTAVRFDELEPLAKQRGSILDVKCNFASVLDPATGEPIFQGMYPSFDEETRKRHRDLFWAMGDTHYQINCPTTAGSYHNKDGWTDWLIDGKMDIWVSRLKELIDHGFYPVIFMHSGDYPVAYQYPGYYKKFVESVPEELRSLCIWVIGHECIPSQHWTTKEYCDANHETRLALGGEPQEEGPFMAMHGGDGRLSFSSNPPEPDDPFQSDELASWRKGYKGFTPFGRIFKFFFYQSENLWPGQNLNPDVPGSIAERAMECLTRVLGTRWHGAPDWFEGLGYRPIPVVWEQSEELFCQHLIPREWMLKVWAAFKAMGWKGYGCGQ